MPLASGEQGEEFFVKAVGVHHILPGRADLCFSLFSRTNRSKRLSGLNIEDGDLGSGHHLPVLGYLLMD